MVAPLRFVGTRPLTERVLDRVDRPPTPPCDGSYTDPWEGAEALHGPLYGSRHRREDHPLGLPDTLAGLL